MKPAHLAERLATCIALASIACLPSLGCNDMSKYALSEAHADNQTRVVPAKPAELILVERASNARSFSAGGVVKAKTSMDLGFKLPGVISSVRAQEGTAVRKGQVLAQLDGTEYYAGAEQAKAAVEKGERDVGRLVTLHKEGTIALADLQNAQTGLSVARASLTQAAHNASRTVIVAPEDGVVVKRYAEGGELAAPGKPVVRFEAKAGGKLVRVALIDKDALRLKLGDKCEVSVDAKGGLKGAGEITEIGSSSSPQTGLVEVEVRSDVLLREVPDGFSAKVVFSAEEPGYAVPSSSVFDENGMAGAVFLAEGSPGNLRAKRVSIRVLNITEKGMLIDGAIPAGSRLIVRGTRNIKEGDLLTEAPRVP
jgi:RND family efflux transporter MFP subunit